MDPVDDELDELHIPHHLPLPLSKSSVDLSDDERDSAMDTVNEAMNELDAPHHPLSSSSEASFDPSNNDEQEEESDGFDEGLE